MLKPLKGPSCCPLVQPLQPDLWTFTFPRLLLIFCSRAEFTAVFCCDICTFGLMLMSLSPLAVVFVLRSNVRSDRRQRADLPVH